LSTKKAIVYFKNLRVIFIMISKYNNIIFANIMIPKYNNIILQI